MRQAGAVVDELKEMGSSLAGISKAMPFIVPEGYFGRLSGSVCQTVTYIDANDISPMWGAVKAMPYSVPTGYFDSLTSELVVAASLENLPRSGTFGVPRGYFEQLPAQMLQAAKAAGEQSSRVKKGRSISFNVFRQVRWAAAAVVLLAAGIGMFEINNQQKQLPEGEALLASVSTSDISDYLRKDYRVDVESLSDAPDVAKLQVDKNDIIEYLNETGWD